MNKPIEYLKIINGVLKNLSTEEQGVNIYHYTSAFGFNKIVEDGTLRFTNRFFLNDYSEGVYCLDLLTKHIDTIIDKSFPLFTEKEKILKCTSDYRKSTKSEDFQVYQISFSQSEDSLCMWNYYTKGDTCEGYNLEFNSSSLCENIKFDLINENKEPYKLRRKVLYTEREQIEAIRKYIRQVYQSISIDEKHPQPFANRIKEQVVNKCFLSRINSILHTLSLLGIFFKKPCFEIEKEYRIAIVLSFNENMRVIKNEKLYENKHGIDIPYLLIKYNQNAIQSVRISPVYDFEKGKEEVLKVLIKAGIQDTPIIKSEIPLRF